MYVFVSHPLNTEWYAFQKLYNRPLKIGSFMPIKFPTSALLIMNHGVHSGWKSWNSWKNWKMGLFSEFGWKSCETIWFSPTLAGKAGISIFGSTYSFYSSFLKMQLQSIVL